MEICGKERGWVVNRSSPRGADETTRATATLVFSAERRNGPSSIPHRSRTSCSDKKKHPYLMRKKGRVGVCVLSNFASPTENAFRASEQTRGELCQQTVVRCRISRGIEECGRRPDRSVEFSFRGGSGRVLILPRVSERALGEGGEKERGNISKS